MSVGGGVAGPETVGASVMKTNVEGLRTVVRVARRVVSAFSPGAG